MIPANSIININITYIQRGLSANEHLKNKLYGLSMNDICLENWLVENSSQNNDSNENSNDKDNTYGIRNNRYGNKKFVMNDSFTAFGAGMRYCVGRQVAMKELYLILGYLILHYQFRPQNNDASFDIKRRFGLTVSIENQINVVVDKRGMIRQIYDTDTIILLVPCHDLVVAGPF